MTNDEVWSMLVRWIAAKTAGRVIRYRAGGKEPAEPYIAVNYLGNDPVRDWEQHIEYVEAPAPLPGDTYPIVTGSPLIEVEWRFSAHGYGPNCSDILRPLVSAVRLTETLEPIEPDFSINRVGDIQILPEYVNEKWQERSQIDIFVRGMTADGFAQSVIDVIPFTINGTAGSAQKG